MFKKRFISLLVLLAAVATGAMAQTGYNGAALPAGPDMSGDVINVTAANAQYVLDGAYGSINGKTINFTENVTSRLDIARPTKYEGSGTSGYTRTLSNVTFTANEGVTLAGFYCKAGRTRDTGETYDYVLDRSVNPSNVSDPNAYTRVSTVSNVTFSGLTITGADSKGMVYFEGTGQSATYTGITFNGCTITNTSGIAVNFNNSNGEYGSIRYGAISFTNCRLQGTAGLIVNKGLGSGNISLNNNYIVGDNTNNAIQISYLSGGTGSVTITGNYLKSDKYTVNLYEVPSGKVTLTGNVVVAGSRGHLGYYSGDASGNFWAPQGATPDADGMMTTSLTAPILASGSATSTSYYDFAIVNTSAETWVSFERTYNVTFKADTEDATSWQGKAGEGEYQALPLEGVAAGTAVSVKYFGTKKVESVKAVKKAAPAPARTLAEATAEDLGKVVGADGKIYATKAAAEAANTTAVAMICYVNEGHGLALALTDEGDMDWNTALTTCAAHTPAVTGATWKLASKSEMNLMINAAGNYAALRDGFSAVGGTNMIDEYYWLSDESSSDYAENINFSYGSWSQEFKSDSYKVRACLAF